MDEGCGVVLGLVDELETHVRRLSALVAAARDMVSVVSSPDRSLEHAQELLAIADEMSPGMVSEFFRITAHLKLTAQAVAVPTRAA